MSDGIESKPQVWTILAPLERACGVGGVDRPAHEQDLAGQVGVVRPRGCACLDERLAVLEVRADRGRHDLRGCRQRTDRLAILAVGDDKRPVNVELVARALELLLRASAERDLDIGRCLLGQILGRQHANEAGRSIDDDVVVTRGVGHSANLPQAVPSRVQARDTDWSLCMETA